jgi:hypothetical protein
LACDGASFTVVNDAPESVRLLLQVVFHEALRIMRKISKHRDVIAVLTAIPRDANDRKYRFFAYHADDLVNFCGC